VAFSTTHADVRLGDASVIVRDDGSYAIEGAAHREQGSGPPLTIHLVVTPAPRAYFPGASLGSEDLVSGYVVAGLRASASGTICEGTRCERYDGAQSYHDHNWGVWQGVTWDWGASRVGAYTILYGRVIPPASVAETPPLFVYLVDSLGFRAVFRPRDIRYTDGRTITVGGRYFASLEHVSGILLLRLRDDGTPDVAFGSGGLVLHPTSALAGNAWVDGLLPLGDGGVMVAGPADCMGECVLLGRFTATGILDPSFGLKFAVPPTALDFVVDVEQRHAIAQLPDGRILVGLAAWRRPFFETRTDLLLLRFMPDGTPDAGFGESGWRTYTTEDPCVTCGPANPSESYDRFHDFMVANGTVTVLGRVLFEQSTGDTDYITLTRLRMDDVFGDGFD